MGLRGAALFISVATTFVFAAQSSEAYQEAPVTGGGTIKGKIFYKGDVPIRTVVPTKDQAVCGGVREEPEVKCPLSLLV